jgi:hypothetical protein
MPDLPTDACGSIDDSDIVAAAFGGQSIDCKVWQLLALRCPDPGSALVLHNPPQHLLQS